MVFISLLVWFAINLALWYSGGSAWGSLIGFPQGYAEATLPIDVSRFWSPAFLWFYLWFFLYQPLFLPPFGNLNLITVAALVGMGIGIHLVQYLVWGTSQCCGECLYNPFYDLIQKMLSSGGGDVNELYTGVLTALYIAMVAVTLMVLNLFLSVTMSSVGVRQ